MSKRLSEREKRRLEEEAIASEIADEKRRELLGLRPGMNAMEIFLELTRRDEEKKEATRRKKESQAAQEDIQSKPDTPE